MEILAALSAQIHEAGEGCIAAFLHYERRYTIGDMQRSPTGSFLKFTFGFITFLVVSFGLTLAVSNVSKAENAQQQAAAAEALILK